MNIDWVDKAVNEYYKWLRDKTHICKDELSGWSKITTPFIGLFNDSIDIFVKLDGDKLLLSDDGQTLSNLDLVGVSISRSNKRREFLETILLNYGVRIDNNEICTDGTERDFNQKKHNLICAISDISDMAMLSKNTVASLFKDDVRNFLDEKGIINTPSFIAKGSTGIEFTFDFQIAGRQKEIVIKSFNNVNKLNVPNFLFGWEDIKADREKTSGKKLEGLAIINDVDKELKSEYIGAIKGKGADVNLWSERDRPEFLTKMQAA